MKRRAGRRRSELNSIARVSQERVQELLNVFDWKYFPAVCILDAAFHFSSIVSPSMGEIIVNIAHLICLQHVEYSPRRCRRLSTIFSNEISDRLLDGFVNVFNSFSRY